MKTVRITKEHYDNILWRAMVASSAQNEQEFETAIRLMRKLKNPDHTKEHELDDETKQKLKPGEIIYLGRYMTSQDMELSLEEDEYKMMVDRIKKYIPKVSFVALEDFGDLLKSVENATEVK